MTKSRNWLGSGMVLGLAMLFAPVAVQAQTPADVLAVQDAIKAELARPGSGIMPSAIDVSNVRFEGDFATADVMGSNFGSPVVFAKKTENEWAVVLVGVETGPDDCQHIGFPAGSQMCPN